MTSPLEKDEEVKDEQAIGRVLLLAFKHPRTWMVIAGLLGGVSILRETTRPDGENVDTFSPGEMRELMRKEISPLRAGIEELAKAQSPRVQVAVLSAMLKAERRNAETP